jgi:TIR domain
MSSKKSQIFISYARSDKVIAEQLTRSFKQQGLSVWLDYESLKPGSSWQDELENALRRADIFVVVLSEDSVKSNWVNAEIGFALGQKKKIVPILVDNVRLPLNLTKLQYIDARKLNPEELGKMVAASVETPAKK